MLSGKIPYHVEPGRDPMDAVLNFDLVPLVKRCPELPAALVAVVDRCLAEKPANRYDDAVALEEALLDPRLS